MSYEHRRRALSSRRRGHVDERRRLKIHDKTVPEPPAGWVPARKATRRLAWLIDKVLPSQLADDTVNIWEDALGWLITSPYGRAHWNRSAGWGGAAEETARLTLLLSMCDRGIVHAVSDAIQDAIIDGYTDTNERDRTEYDMNNAGKWRALLLLAPTGATQEETAEILMDTLASILKPESNAETQPPQ